MFLRCCTGSELCFGLLCSPLRVCWFDKVIHNITDESWRVISFSKFVFDMAGSCKLKYQSFYFSIIFWLIYHSLIYYQKLRSSHRRSSVRKGVLRNFAKFIGKHLYQRLFFNKAAGRGHLLLQNTSGGCLCK